MGVIGFMGSTQEPGTLNLNVMNRMNSMNLMNRRDSRI
jgi:hypothetical protein